MFCKDFKGILGTLSTQAKETVVCGLIQIMETVGETVELDVARAGNVLLGELDIRSDIQQNASTVGNKLVYSAGRHQFFVVSFHK